MKNKKAQYPVVATFLLLISVVFVVVTVQYIMDNEPTRDSWKEITIKDKFIESDNYYVLTTEDEYYNIWTLAMFNGMKINNTYIFDTHSGSSTYISYYEEVTE